MEIKNKLTDQSGEGREIMGQRRGRVIKEDVKDPWTKTTRALV